MNPYISLDRIENIIIMLIWNSSAVKGKFLLGKRKNERVIKKKAYKANLTPRINTEAEIDSKKSL